MHNPKLKQALLKNNEQADQYYKLLHRVFIQTDDGAKLLDIWLNAVMMTEGHEYGKDPYDVGRVEGRKAFVREIYLQSKQAEER